MISNKTFEVKGVALTGDQRKDFNAFFEDPEGDEDFLKTNYVSNFLKRILKHVHILLFFFIEFYY